MHTDDTNRLKGHTDKLSIKAIENGYHQMAADEQREKEAEMWCESLVDVSPGTLNSVLKHAGLK